MDYDIYRFGKIDSTNSYLLRLGDEGFPEGIVAVADEQSEGRGRFGRRWEAESLSNLLFSILLRPTFLGRDEVFILTFSAAVAVSEALEIIAGVTPELKWPNDVLLDGKKVCGILLESSFEASSLSYIVIGVGLNVNQSTFPDEIKEKATSLLIATGRKFDREDVLSAVLTRFGALYENLKNRDFYSVMKRWRDRSKMFGRNIQLKLAENVIEGTMEDVTDDGAILIRTSSGLQKFTAGEITVSKIVTPSTGEKD